MCNGREPRETTYDQPVVGRNATAKLGIATDKYRNAGSELEIAHRKDALSLLDSA